MRSGGPMVSAAMMIASLMPAVGAAHAQEVRQPPYWASVAAGEALMRTGPGQNYPGMWLYRRPDLPIRVVARHESWRKVEEPDGTQGWMAVVLLSDQRSGIVTGGERPMHITPDAASKVTWRAAEGVIGRVSNCGNGWCRFDVRGRVGFIQTAHIWGVEAGEAID